MTRHVHLVYPHDQSRIAAPWSIGNELGRRFEADGWAVKHYDWAERVRMQIAPDDVLIGHPHDNPGFAFTDNLYQTCAAKIALAPWNGSGEYSARIDQVIDYVDHYLAICGPYWARKAREYYGPKVTCLDMALDIDHYPRIVTDMNPVGERRILYIGCCLPCKGVRFLAELAAAMPGVEFGHIGPGLIPGTYPYGYLDLSTAKGQSIVARHDFVIAPGENDANPTTILEAMAWGLLPIATDRAGWESSTIHKIVYGDVEKSVEIIRGLLEKPDHSEDQTRNIRDVARYYNWDEFYKDVKKCLIQVTQLTAS